MSKVLKDSIAVDDQDDNASIATTLDEEVDSDQEWLVNNVMAEAEIGDEVRYLIDWHGFPLHEASWEPEENLGEDLLKTWREAKELEPMRKESDFAIWRWREAVINRLNQRMTRHKQRNRRREERGLPKSQTIDILMKNSLEYLQQMPKGAEPDAKDAACRPEQTTDSLQANDHVSEAETLPIAPPDGLPGADTNNESRVSAHRNKTDKDVKQPTKAQAPKNPQPAPTVAPKPREDSNSKPTTASTRSSTQSGNDGKPKNMAQVAIGAQVAKLAKEKHQGKFTKEKQAAKVSKEPNASKTGPPNPGKPSAAPTSPSVARRSSISQGEVENVFKGGTMRKPRRTLLEASVDPKKKPQMLRSRQQWQLEKGFRDREGEVAPSQRPTTLISLDPNDQRAVKQVKQKPTSNSDEQNHANHEDDDDVQIIDPPQPNQESEPSPTISDPKPALSNASLKEQNIQETTSSEVRDAESPQKERPKLNKKKSVHWDDNVIVQEPVNIEPEEPEESLFFPDQQPVYESPTLKEEHPEQLGQSPGDVDESSSKPEDVPVTTKKVTLKNYQRRSGPQSIIKPVRFGTGSEKKLSLTFDKVPQKDANSWVQLFEEEELLTFGHTCTAGDFSSRLAELQSAPLHKGSVTWSTDTDSIEAIADNLRLASLGALCHGTEFCVLVYPCKCEDWESANPSLFEKTTNAPLRYIIFQPNSTFTSSFLAPFGNYSKARKHGAQLDISPRIHESFFGFEYKSLIPRELQDTSKHPFYLAFTKSAEQDGILLALWLRTCNPDCQIIPSALAGSWHSFLKLNRGVIIIHEDAVSAIRLFPGIASLLHSPDAKVRCWVFSKSLRPWGLFASLHDTSTRLGDIRLDPLFQPGVAVLLTPSFLAAQPEQTYNLLKWFRQNYVEKREVYRRGRLVLCADIGDWYSDLISEKAELRGRVTKSFEQRRMALHDDAFRARLKVLELFRDLVISVDEYDSPILLAPESIDGNDEQSLVNWFGTWTMAHLDQFKKFTVVGSSDLPGPQKLVRLSRMIKTPVFSRDSTSDPDELYKSLDEEEATKQLQLAGPGVATQVADGQSEPPMEFIKDDDPRTLIDYLSHLTDEISSQAWCPLILYKFPVSYWNADMAYHFGDYTSIFKSYQACYSYFRPFCRVGVRERFNTTAAFFYTIEGDWDPAAYPRDVKPKRRPWIAIFRPANVNVLPWRETELLIWDLTPNKKWEKSNFIYEEDLIEAQRELIKFLSKNTDMKHDGTLPLTKVWLNGYNAPPTGFKHPLDASLQYLEKFIRDLKYWAAAIQSKLPLRGWREVKPRNSTRSPSPLPDLDLMDIDVPEFNIPDAEIPDVGVPSVAAPVIDDILHAKTIFHPPRGNRPLGTTLCKNRLYRETKSATQRGPVERFEYLFPPTMVWYGQQLAEGRGYEHIKVTTWDDFFNSYNIPDPKSHLAR